jgi:hypothetical protein
MASQVVCGHGGTVAVQSTTKLGIASHPVLLASSIDSRSISGCQTLPASDATGPTAIACSAVSAITAGSATKLTVGGQPVILETLAGDTNGMVNKVTPQTLLAGTADQNKLTSV